LADDFILHRWLPVELIIDPGHSHQEFDVYGAFEVICRRKSIEYQITPRIAYMS
jgi:hypothetical protein